MNYDITFCSKLDCNNLECKRNQKNYQFSHMGNVYISIAEFKECKKWKEGE